MGCDRSPALTARKRREGAALVACVLALIAQASCGKGVSVDPFRERESPAIDLGTGGSGGRTHDRSADGGTENAHFAQSGGTAFGGFASENSSGVANDGAGSRPVVAGGSSLVGFSGSSGGTREPTAGAAGVGGVAGQAQAGDSSADAGDTFGGAGGTRTTENGGAAGGPHITQELSCDPALPFAEPVPVPGLMPGVARARFSQDERTAYFAIRFADLNWRIAMESRADRTGAFGSSPISLLVFDSFTSFSPSPSDDGRAIYFETLRSNTWQISVARRSAPTEAFSASSPVAETYSPSEASGGPYILPDESAIYFHRTSRNGDLYRAERMSSGFREPVALTSVNSSASESFPVVSGDELVLYFASAPEGGAGDPDIWMAWRSTKEEAFGTIQPLTSLNTAKHEFPTWVSADGCRLYFERGASNWTDNQIWVAERIH